MASLTVFSLLSGRRDLSNYFPPQAPLPPFFKNSHLGMNVNGDERASELMDLGKGERERER